MTVIEHTGTVCGVKEGILKVRIEKQSACGSCAAKDVCGLLESGEKMIDVPTGKKHYNNGEKVTVLLEEEKGWKALMWGYLLPLLLVIVTLLVTQPFMPEWKAGVLSLASTLPYYGLLYLLRNRLKRFFVFRLKEE